LARSVQKQTSPRRTRAALQRGQSHGAG